MKIFGFMFLFLSVILYFIVEIQGKNLSIGTMRIEIFHCGILFVVAILFLIWGLARETKAKYPKHS